jgi:hypothetical protein
MSRWAGRSARGCENFVHSGGKQDTEQTIRLHPLCSLDCTPVLFRGPEVRFGSNRCARPISGPSCNLRDGALSQVLRMAPPAAVAHRGIRMESMKQLGDGHEHSEEPPEHRDPAV